MLNTWDQDRKHMKYRSEMSWRKVPFPLHGSPLLILLFSPLFFCQHGFFPHKIRQGYAFHNLFCAYMRLAFFPSLLPFDPSVSSAFHLPPRLWRTDATAWIKSFFLHISAGLLWHFFSYAAIYPASKYKHIYSTLSCILKPITWLTAKSRRLHRGFSINCW